MFKQALIHAVVKEMQICKRLFTKVPLDKLTFQPKEGIRTLQQLMQYLCIIGTAMPLYWLQEEEEDFGSFFKRVMTAADAIEVNELQAAMDRQIAQAHELINTIREEDLYQRNVKYPWGETAPLGEAIMQTSVKWIAAYKLQFFLYIKLCTDQSLGTPDAWVLTELEQGKAGV